MAVESRYVVIREGVEVQTFMDKKSADEYDKMLDMADNLAELFSTASLELTESMTEELSIYIAQNREQVLIALQAKKPAKKAVEKPVEKLKPVENAELGEKPAENAKPVEKEKPVENTAEKAEIKSKPKTKPKSKLKSKLAKVESLSDEEKLETA